MSYLVQKMNIGVPLELFELKVLLQRPRVELLVGSDDMNAALHPPQVVLRRRFARSCLYDDRVWHIVASEMSRKGVHVGWL